MATAIIKWIQRDYIASGMRLGKPGRRRESAYGTRIK